MKKYSSKEAIKKLGITAIGTAIVSFIVKTIERLMDVWDD